jgi:thiol-disulfide isomerase/thioredoxin
MRLSCLLLMMSVLLAGTQAVIHHLTDKNFIEKVNDSPFTLVYFYSSGCKFCKEFTPKF